MKTILDTIVEHKKMEVMKRRSRKPLAELTTKSLYNRLPVDPLKSFSADQPAIIAEFKRKSPSKGIISNALNPVTIVKAYQEAGAAVCSVLTDRDFFGGSFKDLQNVKEATVDLPLLRKDFIIDPYQVHEAKAYGADVILLIAAILDKSEVDELTRLARDLGLSVLLEVHNKEEVELWNEGISMIGVNNRDLKDFSVDIERSVNLLPDLPGECIKISESALNNPRDVRRLYELGFQGFLMGEHFMKEDDPGTALADFLEELNPTK